MIDSKAMTGVDYFIVALIVISGLIGLSRGFIREVFSLVAWALAIWVALKFSHQGANLLVGIVAVPPSLRIVIAFLVLLLGTLLVASITNSLMSQIVEKTGLTGTDQVLGVVFGVTRGVAVVTLLVLMAGMTSMPQDPWWRHSLLLSHFQKLALWARTWMPPDMAAYVQF